MSIEQELRVKTASLTRMLNLQGVIGMFGHVSIRVPGTDKCFISPGASTEKSTVRPEDVFLYNVDGTIIEHPGGLIPLEWRIHTQIHRDRRDAMCVCHLHAPAARALAIAGKPLKPMFLHGAFLCTGVPTWDNPRLVVTDDQAGDLSRALGHHCAAQMRGHGSVVVGASAEEAFFACTFLEENAQIQLQADINGGGIPLSEDEARDCRTGTFNPRLFALLWNFYERRAALPQGLPLDIA
jgi:ribulose-5-phosphate 4-epimerase/fuculose-1-phosphate aldolase